MGRRMEITIHKVAEDGLPDMDKLHESQVAFIFNGAILSGFPWGADRDEVPDDPEDVRWEPNSELSEFAPFIGVTHWAEFSEPLEDVEGS